MAPSPAYWQDGSKAFKVLASLEVKALGRRTELFARGSVPGWTTYGHGAFSDAAERAASWRCRPFAEKLDRAIARSGKAPKLIEARAERVNDE